MKEMQYEHGKEEITYFKLCSFYVVFGHLKLFWVLIACATTIHLHQFSRLPQEIKRSIISITFFYVGTFLCNNEAERERLELAEKTTSLW